jgi:hypothetical protein
VSKAFPIAIKKGFPENDPMEAVALMSRELSRGIWLAPSGMK